jgi:hypothetical protein
VTWPSLATGLVRIAAAVAAGEITPEKAQAVAGLLEAQRRAIETAEIEQRLVALEARNAK